MTNDPHAPSAHPDASAPPQGGWGGEYDADATAFIQLPPQVTEDGPPGPGHDGRTPLAAPGTGQGWEPPVIPPPTPAATTDPTDTGTWTLPFAPAVADPSAEGGPGDGPAAASAALGQGAAAALAGSHEGRMHADTGAAEPPEQPWAAPAPGGAEPYGTETWDTTAFPAGPHATEPFPAAEPPAFVPHPSPAPDAAAPAAPDAASEPGRPSGATAAPPPEPAEEPPAAAPPAEDDEHPLVSYTLHVNGTERHVADVWLGESLLYVLRERLGLAGAKDGCSQGECGACSVQVDGRLVASCLVPAATAAGCEIRTVEGLSRDGVPSDVQRALAERSGVQCGFCVPGMAMTAHDLLEGNHAPTDLQIRTALCGNLCRCTGYRGVVDAVREVAAERAARSRPQPEDRGGSVEDTGGAPRIPQQAGPSDEGDPQ
ncbi:2Fe-2S iron-sulfur cluster-binding protein [Streptomyces sp. GSL17-111]|uniref:2Fe-2S iron-sulfur cluster-binding protein n=1 Tax=Streptomyces sp. GSL17-111 TaxID=3121596 RepID=UPI0030F451FB